MAQLQMAIVAIAHALVAAAEDLFEAAAQAIASVPGSGFLADFVLSESGEVSPEQGFPVAWTGGLLVAAMVVLGSPPQAAAHCNGYIRTIVAATNDTECSHYCSHHEFELLAAVAKARAVRHCAFKCTKMVLVRLTVTHQDGNPGRPGVFRPVTSYHFRCRKMGLEMGRCLFIRLSSQSVQSKERI